MSGELFSFAMDFLNGNSEAGAFADEYIHRWGAERDAGLVRLDPDPLSEILSSIFCLADMYSPDPDPELFELDEDRLKIEIRKVIAELSDGQNLAQG